MKFDIIFIDGDHTYEQVIKDIYNSIKDKTIDEICMPDGGLFPDFGRRKTNNGKAKNDSISFRVKKNEYEIIKNASEKAGVSISEYCKQTALQGKIVTIDRNVFNMIDETIEKFNKRDQLLKQIMSEISNKCVYYPVDLEIIKKAIEENLKQQLIEHEKLEEILNLILNIKEVYLF